MAEKSIQISIAAVGAGQTAAEINSVTTAVKEQGDAISQLQAKINISDNSRVGAGDRITGNPFQTERDERVKNQHFESINAQKDMEDEAAARAKQIEQEEAAALAEKELAAAKKATAKAVAEEAAAEEAATLARENANRSLIMNIGRYSGLRKEMYLTQSATKAAGLSLSGPVMLGILALSTALPIVIDLIKKFAAGMKDTGDEAETAGGKVKSFDEKLADAKKHAVELKSAKEHSKSKAFIDGIKDEVTAIDSENDAIQRGIELIREKRRSDMQRFSAHGDMQLAMIDADKEMSEPEKIKARAKVEEEIRKKEHESKLDEMQDRIKMADLEMSRTNKKLSDNGSAQVTAELDIKYRKEEIDKTKADKTNLHILQESMKANQALIDEAEKQAAQFEHPASFDMMTGQTVFTTPSQSNLEDAKKKREEIAARKKQQDESQNKINQINSDFEALPGKEEAIKEIEKTLSELKDTEKALRKSLPEIETKAREIKKQVEETLIPNENERFHSVEKKQYILEGGKIEEEKKKEEKKAEQEAQRARERDLQSEESSVPISEAHAREVFEQASKSKTAFPKLNNSIEDIAKHLEKNPSLQELEKLFKDFTTTTQGNNSATINILRTAITELLDHKRVIELLRSQIRGARIAQ